MGRRLQLFAIACLISGCVGNKSIGRILAEEDGQAEDAAMEGSAEEQLDESGATDDDDHTHPCQQLDHDYKDPQFAWHQDWLTDSAKLDLRNRNDVIALGRVLFYDPKLSAEGSTPGRSCASCHDPRHAFASAGTVAEGERDVPALINLRWFPEGDTDEPGRGGFFLDGRANTVEDAVRESLREDNYLGANLEQLPEQLGQFAYYPPLFAAAFETHEVSGEQLVTAISAFLRAYTSSTSQGDRLYGMLNVENKIPTEQEIREAIVGLSGEGLHAGHIRGWKLFYGIGHCHNCHGPWPAEFRVSFANIGLTPESDDPGLANITGEHDHRSVFKAPFLRSLKVTAPYMHDGRFDALNQVLDHYAGGRARPHNLHPLVEAMPDYNEDDLKALASFIDLWHDTELLADRRFHDPFACDE